MEGQEQLVSLLLEDHGDLIDDLATGMAADETIHFQIDGAMPLSQLREMMDTIYRWTDQIDYTRNDALARVWYVSEEKLEPRLGERFDEPIERIGWRGWNGMIPIPFDRLRIAHLEPHR